MCFLPAGIGANGKIELYKNIYPKSRPVRHTFTERHTHTGRESHLCVSFIGDDTLLRSGEWDLMSQAPAHDSPMGEPHVREENGGKITRKGGRDRDCEEPEKMRAREIKERKRMQS